MCEPRSQAPQHRQRLVVTLPGKIDVAGRYITSCALPSIDPTGNHLLVSCGKFGRLDHGRFTTLPGDALAEGAAAW